jgi:RNA polymerase sigma-70 factor (ECF subfamily)
MHVDTLYRRYGAFVYSRCKRMLRDSAAAEDATQEVFVRVIRHVDTAPTDESVMPWLHRISTNYCLNALRNAGNRPEPVAELPELAGEDPEPVMADRDAAARALRLAPDKLSAPARLHWLEGCTQHEVAETLRLSRRTVVTRLAQFAATARAELI